LAELGYGGEDEPELITSTVRCDTSTTQCIHDVRADGVDVAGVFFWTGFDNYEWLAGDGGPFGLFDRERRPRRSAELVRTMAPTAGGRFGPGTPSGLP
jgi:beta-glucosidase